MNVNAEASSSRSGSMSGTRPNTSKDEEVPVSATQKKQNDFRRYLAGQSVMKSGLTRDPQEVEAIIAEASKNSKFYLREVEKDRVLGKKIEQLLKLKDQMIKTANMERLEREANEVLAQLESTRDLTQYIIHVDMDAFYANVEVKKDPSLKGKAFGVGSGVLTTASYEARKFGCRSGMAGFVAKKLCPQIIFVKPDFAAYSEASKAVREILLEYDENMAMAGMDEGYLNITPYMATHEMTASEVVSHLRAEVEARTGLTISAGIAPNTMLAKICSDKNKPNGQYELPFEGKAIREFMRDLPVRRIPGIGRVAERYAQALGVKVCGDAYTHRGVIKLMDRYIGFRYMMRAYLGLGNNVVEPGKREDRKSVGCERTFREKSNSDEILDMLREIADSLEEDLKRTGFSGRTVVVKYKLHTYENFTRQCGAPRYINSAEDILPLARSLLVKELPLKIRLLGIRMTHLKDLRADEKGIQKFFKESSSKGVAENTKSTENDSDDDEPIWLDSDVENEPAAGNQEQGVDRKRKRPDIITTIDDDSEDDGIEVVCPVCGKAFPASTKTNSMNHHITACLDQQNDTSKAKGNKQDTPRATKKIKSKKTAKPKDVFEMLMRGRK